ncbi:MAG: hypothetical protein JWQ98_3180 [Chlorobi bacterium]|nr:hypothetical protein [Chlorobiota bacterium]
MSESDIPPAHPDGRLRAVYAFIWRATEPDETFRQEEFESRIPRLMAWLKDLKSRGKLLGCGGGGFEHHAAGLTLVAAESEEEARELSAGSPMNEIGTTDIMIWDVFYANLAETGNEGRLI